MYKLFTKIQSKIFSVMISRSFGKFGRNSVIACPVGISGEDRIEIGDRVFIGSNSWLQTLPDEESKGKVRAIVIGDRTSIVGFCVISAVRRVVLEDDVLLARNVYIADHMHRYTDKDFPVHVQGLDKIAPVVIRHGAWIGQNVVICPGVTIGVGAVIGANSLVNIDVPDHCLAVGSPARVVKCW